MFADFPTQNTTEWLDAIQKILKGQSAEVLETPLYEGFNLKPFYNQADALPALLTEADFLPFHTCLNVVYIKAQDPTQDIQNAENAVNKGADMVCYVFENDSIKLEDYIAQTKVPFGIKLKNTTLLQKNKAESNLWLFVEAQEDENQALQNWQMPYRKVWHVDFQEFEERGANAVQSLAFGFAQMVELVQKYITPPLPASAILQAMRVSTSITENYFVEIAKIRAMRVIWRNILNAYQADFEPLYIHASATLRNKTTQDPYNNLLRNTTEAMAGIIAGADSFSVLPYTATSTEPINQDDALFAQRIARNTLVLLKEEAHLDKVTDASAGSFYIETLTKELAERAWTLFQEIERKGGFMEAKAFIETEIKATAQKRQADFEAGKLIRVGVNKYAPKK